MCEDSVAPYLDCGSAKGSLELLCLEFPFTGLEDDLLAILLYKAESMNLEHVFFESSVNYYKILYSYYILHGDYRNGTIFDNFY